MAGWPDLAVDAEQLVAEIVARTKSVKASYIGWHALISSTSGTGGMLAAQKYQEMAAYRTFMAGAVASDAADIAAVYLRHKPNLGTFDPAARWAEVNIAILAFLQWVRDNWPKKVAVTGEPAFQRWNAAFELEDLPVTFGAGPKGQVLANIDAVIAALPTQ